MVTCRACEIGKSTNRMTGIPPKKVYVFRFTNIKNVKWILQNGIPSINSSLKYPMYKGVGEKSIIIRRGAKQVPIPPYGNLNDYVPFYFAPLSPMLYTLTKNGKIFPEETVFLVTSINELDKYDHSYVFTDGHALMVISNFYCDTQHLVEVDWPLMNDRIWRDTIEDNDRKRRREAEFLIKDLVQPQSIIALAGYSQKNCEDLQQIVTDLHINIRILHKPVWYY
jgi:hypothetical protein